MKFRRGSASTIFPSGPPTCHQQQIHEILDTDFATFVGGHANIGKKSDVARYLAYLEALYESVIDGRRRGLSLEELKSEIRLDEFQDLVNYDEWLPLNIEGVYRTLNDQSYLDLQENRE